MTTFAPRLTEAHRAFLNDLFPGDSHILAPEALAAFAIDASGERAQPWAVVRPETTEQLSNLLSWANTERIPIIGRGRGTGRVGNAVPVHGGIVVSMLRMNRILDVDGRDFTARVQPGVITADLQAACEQKQLFYPPDPASVRISTIGGNVATCAGGMRAVKYGVTRDWVLGVNAVLPGGRILRTGGRSHKNVVGLDLTRLFVGSNGRLGLITELTLKLIPLPESSASILVGFTDLESGLDGAGAIFQAGILPSACEFLDALAISAVRQTTDIALHPDAQAALLFKIDGNEASVSQDIHRIHTALRPHAPASIEVGKGDEEETVWNIRRSISPATFNIKPNKLAEDISVPRGSVAKAVQAAHAIGDDHDLTVLCFGHLGDGNIHVNIMHDAANEREVRSAHKAKDEIFRLATVLGGTISGEHGTGLTKASFVHEQLNQTETDLMEAIRHTFDPNGILNPGKGW